MPACKVGCCPDDICECSNDCECLLPGDEDYTGGLGFESTFPFNDEIKSGPTDLKICPCRTKEELTDYVKPIEPRFDDESSEDIDSSKKHVSEKEDKFQNGVCEKNALKSVENGTHAPHGHKEHSKAKCCDDKGCTAEKDHGHTQGIANPSCCEDESCQAKCSKPSEATHKHPQPTPGGCCEDKNCGESKSRVDSHKHPKPTGGCCDDEGCGAEKSSHESHKHSKPTGGGCCDDKGCGADKHPKPTGGCCDDKSCEEKNSNEEPHHHPKPTGGSCCDDKGYGAEKSSHKTHQKPTGGCCDDDGCKAEKHSMPVNEGCCDDKSCGAEKPKPTSGGCCNDKGCGAGNHPTPSKPAPSGCCDDKSCGEKKPKPISKGCCDDKSCGKARQLSRQNSLPTPSSPVKIAKAPNFEIKPNFLFDPSIQVSPVPYRKTRRSQSLAEARLGSLLSERRPSLFQTSLGKIPNSGTLDPHQGHDHHRVHEYHHYGDNHHHDHHHDHHGNHDHHHDHDHHDDDQCFQDNNASPTSCCDSPTCEDRVDSSERNPLMKDEERRPSKIDIDEMVLQTTKLRVQNMCCPKESQIVQDELRKLEGIENIRVNVIGRVVHVSHYPTLTSPTTLMTILNKRHLGVSIVDTGAQEEIETGIPKSLKIRLANLAVQAVLLAVALGGSFSSGSWYMWVAIVEVCFGILPVLKKVYQAIRNKEIDLNILITITVIGTMIIKEWIEGAAVVFVFTLAGFLQQYCFYRVQKTISSLMLSKPSNAVMACTGECIPIEKVPIGSIIAVRQGELIPLDGIVVKGVASVDESSISGEATPVEKVLESPAYSGTVVQNGYLEIETTSNSNTSTISKISAMVEDAQMNVSPTEIMVNKFAKFYTPLVIVVAALVFLVPLCLDLGGVEAYEGGAKTWGERALIVLVTACPCALLMATPTVVICGINGAARLGALIKGGTFLEALGQLDLLAFDKTGTLTEGKFQVVDLVTADTADESDVLRWAAALESKSSHPLAAAVVNEFTGECVSDFVAEADVLPDVSDFSTMEGQGISGKIEGHDVQVGNRSLLDKLGVTLTPKFEAAYISFCTDAKTVIFVCVDGELALMISLADIIRWESRAALTWLQDLGVHLCMLTGDAKATANAVQKELKLDSWVSDMKPDDKLNWIVNVKEQEVRQRRFGCFRKNRAQMVGMVGDGVNDGPALAASNVGIAMAAGGSALAVEAAGVALMNNSLLKVPEMICLSRFCRRIILENIILSVLLKLVFVIIALTGYVRVWMAVLADLVGLVAVILNGLRPLKWKPPRSKNKSEPPRASFKRKRPVLMFETVV